MSLPDFECACVSVRRAARLITQLYGNEMGAAIEPSQFSLLSVLSRVPGRSQAALGEALGLDKTSLSRNLRLMGTNGWIEPIKNADRRERGYRLTPSGEEILSQSTKGWKRAQQKLRAAMTEDDWADTQRVLGLLARTAHQLNEAPKSDRP